MTEGDIVAAISSYRKSKSQTRPNSQTQGQTQGQKPPCKSCGYQHPITRVCPANGKTCSKCGGKNHFKEVCWTKLWRYYVTRDHDVTESPRTQNVGAALAQVTWTWDMRVDGRHGGLVVISILSNLMSW